METTKEEDISNWDHHVKESLTSFNRIEENFAETLDQMEDAISNLSQWQNERKAKLMEYKWNYKKMSNNNPSKSNNNNNNSSSNGSNGSNGSNENMEDAIHEDDMTERNYVRKNMKLQEIQTSSILANPLNSKKAELERLQEKRRLLEMMNSEPRSILNECQESRIAKALDLSMEENEKNTLLDLQKDIMKLNMQELDYTIQSQIGKEAIQDDLDEENQQTHSLYQQLDDFQDQLDDVLRRLDMCK